MKIALWIVFALLALLWTGGAAAIAQLVQWSAQGLASGSGAALGSGVAGASMPSWLGAWVDPATWSAAQQAVAGALAALSDAMPAIGAAVGWLVPAVWVAWGLGLTVLLGVTALVYWLMARWGRGGASGPSPA
jgi:hypothetical protein